MGLAECVAALLILGLGALAGVQLVALSARAGDALQRAAAANTLLAGRLEQLLALHADDPALDPGGSLTGMQPGYCEELTLDGRVWRIQRLVSPETGGRKLVTLRISSASDEGSRPGPRLSAWVVR